MTENGRLICLSYVKEGYNTPGYPPDDEDKDETRNEKPKAKAKSVHITDTGLPRLDTVGQEVVMSGCWHGFSSYTAHVTRRQAE
jgi:hypothetical protein